MSLCVNIYYSYLAHRPLLALNARLPPPGALGLIQPRASASCCNGIVTATVITTTPSNASAATMAIIAIVVVISLTPS